MFASNKVDQSLKVAPSFHLVVAVFVVVGMFLNKDVSISILDK